MINRLKIKRIRLKINWQMKLGLLFYSSDIEYYVQFMTVILNNKISATGGDKEKEMNTGCQYLVNLYYVWY